MSFLDLVLLFVFFVFILFIVKEIKQIKQLEKGTEEYKQIKKCFLKFNMVMFFMYILEFLVLLKFFSFTCSCGHYFYNTIPISVFLLVQFIINFAILNRFKNTGISIWILLVYLIISIVLVIGILRLSRLSENDMDKLHTIDIDESMLVEMFNNKFYRYANDGDKILGTRARELNLHRISVQVDASGDIPTFNDRKQYKITYTYDNDTTYIDSVNFDEQ